MANLKKLAPAHCRKLWDLGVNKVLVDRTAAEKMAGLDLRMVERMASLNMLLTARSFKALNLRGVHIRPARTLILFGDEGNLPLANKLMQQTTRASQPPPTTTSFSLESISNFGNMPEVKQLEGEVAEAIKGLGARVVLADEEAAKTLNILLSGREVRGFNQLTDFLCSNFFYERGLRSLIVRSPRRIVIIVGKPDHHQLLEKLIEDNTRPAGRG